LKISQRAIKTVVISSVVALASTFVGVSTSHATETLNVYAALDYSQDVATAFTAKTGIPVTVTALSTGPLLAKITAEKNNPQWGIYWADGAEPCANFDLEKQLLPYTPTGTKFSLVGKKLQPSPRAYNVTGFTEMVGVLYNSSKIAKPKTWDDLTTAKYKGQVGMNNPSISGPTFPFIAGLMNQLGSEQAGKDYLTSLKKNGLQIFDKNSKTIKAMETGLINVGLVQSSAAITEVNKINAAPVKGFTPAVTYFSKTTILPSCIAIDAHVSAVQQSAAKKFVDFAFSTEGQTIMKASNFGDSLFFPTVQGGVASPAAGAIPTLAANLIQIVDPYKWGPIQGEVNDWFTKNIA
jgi:iron(III) transport system substrate-binding protein